MDGTEQNMADEPRARKRDERKNRFAARAEFINQQRFCLLREGLLVYKMDVREVFGLLKSDLDHVFLVLLWHCDSKSSLISEAAANDMKRQEGGRCGLNPLRRRFACHTCQACTRASWF